jgi:hypothetical protein
MAKSGTKPRKGMHKMPAASEEMRRLASGLETELLTWPAVTAKPMFGMTALYRGKSIFAALPKSRALWTANSVAIKMPRLAGDLKAQAAKDKRFVVISELGKGWTAFELNEERDLTAALFWLNVAYELSRVTSALKKSKKAARKKAGR